MNQDDQWTQAGKREGEESQGTVDSSVQGGGGPGKGMGKLGGRLVSWGGFLYLSVKLRSLGRQQDLGGGGMGSATHCLLFIHSSKIPCTCSVSDRALSTRYDGEESDRGPVSSRTSQLRQTINEQDR